MLQELVVAIQLPLCESAAGVDLDITSRSLVLDCPAHNYHLDVKLSYPVIEVCACNDDGCGH